MRISAMGWFRPGPNGAAREPAGVEDSPCDPASVRQHLDKVLASREFAAARRIQQFLAFIVDQAVNGADGIKETEVAIRVFNRGPSFDPSGDSVVRVAASSLRSRLRDYYAGAGRDDAILIEVPKGSYVPVFRRRQPAEGGQAARRPSHPWRLVAAITAIAIVAAACWAVLAWRNNAEASIAILPFLNLTGTPEKEYFTEGFVEELTTSLAQVKGLQVAARSSAFQFRGKSPDIRAAGRQLGVNTVLEGSVSSAGKTIRISAQLIKVADGFHLWSHTYEGEGRDVFAIQSDLVTQIARALQLRGGARLQAVRAAPGLEAYDLYLKGLYFRDKVTPEDLRTSIRYLEQAVQKDPDYAPAYAALADVYATVAYHEVVPEKEAIAKAKAAASKALDLDGSLAEAHALFAWIQCFYDWDWAAGEQGLRRALELNPNSARAHDWHSEALLLAGRFDQALAEARRALALDPLNYRVSANMSVILYCAHRYDEAIRQARQALEINPHYYQAHTIVGASLAQKRMYPEAAAALGAALADYPRDPEATALLAAVQVALGRRDEALELMAALERSEPRPYYYLAFLHAVFGDKDRAFDALDKAYAQRTSDMPFLNVDPAFDSLRQDPRFETLRKGMGWKK
ncbi:MAG: tetratricopeptide repeat protein [Bryobacteraceae bacterium]|jgi:TolB-like protein/Tfp pilus assembly protein PilF